MARDVGRYTAPGDSVRPGMRETTDSRGGIGPGTVPGTCESSDVVGLFGHKAYGPMHVGDRNDKHQFGMTEDGEPINAGHVSTRAFFFDDALLDAPLDFQAVEYPKPGRFPLDSQVHLVYDSSAQHDFNGKKVQGKWKWFAEVPEMKVPPPPPPTTGDGDDDDDHTPPPVITPGSPPIRGPITPVPGSGPNPGSDPDPDPGNPGGPTTPGSGPPSKVPEPTEPAPGGDRPQSPVTPSDPVGPVSPPGGSETPPGGEGKPPGGYGTGGDGLPAWPGDMPMNPPLWPTGGHPGETTLPVPSEGGGSGPSPIPSTTGGGNGKGAGGGGSPGASTGGGAPEGEAQPSSASGAGKFVPPSAFPGYEEMIEEQQRIAKLEQIHGPMMPPGPNNGTKTVPNWVVGGPHSVAPGQVLFWDPITGTYRPKGRRGGGNATAYGGSQGE